MSRLEPESPLRGARTAGHDQPERLNGPLRLVHQHPGYLRLQATAFHESADESPIVAAAKAAAEATPGFRSWSHKPKTGSVVVEYEPGVVEADDLLNQIAKSAGLRGVADATSSQIHRKELVSALLETVQGVNQVVSRLTGDRGDLRELVPVALAATGVVSFVLNDQRGRMPEWSGALYHSYRVFMQWHRREVRTRERVARQEDESVHSGEKSGNAR